MKRMKLTINTDKRFIETEITVNCNQINEEIERLVTSIRMYELKISGKKNGQQYSLEVSDIVYIESVDKRTFLYTLTDTYESSLKLYELEDKLVDVDFLRASKNCLVNLNHIISIENELYSRLILTMPRNVKIIVSRQYAFVIRQKLEAYNG